MADTDTTSPPEIPYEIFEGYCKEHPIEGIIARKLVEEGAIRLLQAKGCS